MDQATQQNAALVEQSAAAADSLRDQAQQLVSAVASFRVSSDGALAAPQSAAPLRLAAPAKAQPATKAVAKAVPKLPAPEPHRPSAAAPARAEPTASAPTKSPPGKLLAVAGGADDDWATF